MMLHLIKRSTISQWFHLFSQQQSTKHMTITVDCCYSQISPTLEHIVALSHYTQSYQQIFVSQSRHPNHIHPRNCGQDNNTLVTGHIGLSPSKKNCFICSNKSPLKMMKNAFYLILKSFFVLKTFNFLS